MQTIALAYMALLSLAWVAVGSAAVEPAWRWPLLCGGLLGVALALAVVLGL